MYIKKTCIINALNDRSINPWPKYPDKNIPNTKHFHHIPILANNLDKTGSKYILWEVKNYFLSQICLKLFYRVGLVLKIDVDVTIINMMLIKKAERFIKHLRGFLIPPVCISPLKQFLGKYFAWKKKKKKSWY